MESNADPYDMDLQELVEYLERLEIVENLRSFNKGTDRERNPKRKRNESKNSNEKGKRKPCKYCDKVHAGKCWFGPGGKHEGKKKTDGAKSSKKSAKQHTFTVEEFQELSHAVLRLHQAKNGGTKNKKKKRKITFQESDEDSSEDEASNMLTRMTLAGPNSPVSTTNKRKDYISYDDSNTHCYPITVDMMGKRPAKKLRKLARTSEIVVEISSGSGQVHRLKALLDSGTTSGIVLKKFVDKNRLSKFKTKPVKWSTLGGVYHTRKKGQVEISLPEFSLIKKITWTFHVDEQSKPELAQYDMIIGDDLMQELGIDLLYSTDVPCSK